MASLHDPPDYLIRHSRLFVTPHGQDCANSLEDIHNRLPLATRPAKREYRMSSIVILRDAMSKHG